MDDRLSDSEDFEQRRLAAIVACSDDAIVSCDPDGKIATWNAAAERLFGYPAQDVLGQSISIIAPSGRVDEPLAILDAVMRGERVAQLETRRRRRDGHELDVALTAFAVSDTAGEIEGAAIIARDVSARKQAESQERAEIESRIARGDMQVAAAHDAARIGSWEWSVRTNELKWSDETFEIFGRSRADYTPTFEGWLAAVHPSDREHAIAAVEQTLATGIPFNFPYKVVLPGGGLRTVRYSGQVITAPGGAPERLVGTARDLTATIQAAEEKERLEARVRQSERLESVGELAGGVAHDFNNLLGVILNYAEFVKEDLGPDHPALPDMEEIRRAGERAAALTRQLLMFSRRERIQTEVLELNAVVEDVERLLSRTLGEHVDLVTSLEAQISRIEADPGQLEQVLVNLAVNARDAMPSGGTLTIETAEVRLDQIHTSDKPDLRPGRYVRLTVRDTGTGIEPEVAEHIFEPFFSSKPKGEGTGLGLATVYGIVTQFGGHIELHTAPGLGSAFKVYLPVSDKEASAAPEVPGRIAAAPARRTILVVEDEPAVRELTSRILEGRGYDVVSADSGPAGIEACARDDTIDLVITDVVMPGMSGPEMAVEIGARKPELAVLYMSGYTDDFVARAAIAEAGTPVLEKPFTADALLAAVDQALDQQQRVS